MLALIQNIDPRTLQIKSEIADIEMGIDIASETDETCFLPSTKQATIEDMYRKKAELVDELGEIV